MGRKPGLPVVFLPPGKTVYLARFTVNGRRFRVSTGCRDLAAAEAEAARLYAKATLGTPPPSRKRLPPSPTLTLEVLAAMHLTDAASSHLASAYIEKREMHFRAHFLPRWQSLQDITPKEIERYQISRRQEGAGHTTIYKELVTLSQFLKWARRQGHLETLPEFTRPKPYTSYRPLDLTRTQVDALLAALPNRKPYFVRDFFTILWAQGMRTNELRTLAWSDVDLERKVLTIHQSNDKARQGRTIGIAPEALAVLARLPRSGPLLFGRRNYRASLALAGERLGLGHVTPHHLRHARLSELGGTTRDFAALQYFAGHKHSVTTDRYVRSRTERTAALFGTPNPER